MKKILLYLICFFSFCASLHSETRERKIGENGKIWYLVCNNNLYGAEDGNGNPIIPVKYSRINYVSNLGYRDYFIVDDAQLEGRVTGYGYNSPFQGIYSYNGDLIIPTTRGYSGIWGFKSKDSDQLFYEFEIKFNGVHIEGICDVHGKELWSRDFQDDHDDAVAYSKYDGFYYISNKTGRKIKLNITIPKSDTSFNTYSSNATAPSFSDRVREAKQEYETLSSGTIRKKHFETNSFTWFECRDVNNNVWAEDVNGITIVPPRYFCVIGFHCSNYTSGFFERRILDDGNYRVEAYTKEGNILIPDTRNYWEIRYPDPSKKYIVVSNKNGLGIVDLNGYEVVEPKFKSLEYDGYDFVGYTKSGDKVVKSIHRRPTPTQKEKISSWGGYYANMPWLMMPGPNYTPTFNIDWNAASTNWNSVSVYGGVGDYVSPETNLIGEDSATSTGNSISSSHKCPFCNGTGRKEVNQSIATFGTTDTKIHCNECGRDFYRSTGHSHVRCGQCRGTGRTK